MQQLDVQRLDNSKFVSPTLIEYKDTGNSGKTPVKREEPVHYYPAAKHHLFNYSFYLALEKFKPSNGCLCQVPIMEA